MDEVEAVTNKERTIEQKLLSDRVQIQIENELPTQEGVVDNSENTLDGNEEADTSPNKFPDIRTVGEGSAECEIK